MSHFMFTIRIAIIFTALNLSTVFSSADDEIQFRAGSNSQSTSVLITATSMTSIGNGGGGSPPDSGGGTGGNGSGNQGGGDTEPTPETSINPEYLDTDKDGISNAEENRRGTNPNNADTDGDGAPDSNDSWPRDSGLKAAAIAEYAYTVTSITAASSWEQSYFPYSIDDEERVLAISGSEKAVALYSQSIGFSHLNQIKPSGLGPTFQSKKGWIVFTNSEEYGVKIFIKLLNPSSNSISTVNEPIGPRLKPAQGEEVYFNENPGYPYSCAGEGRIIFEDAGISITTGVYKIGQFDSVCTKPRRNNYYFGVHETGPAGENIIEHWGEILATGTIVDHLPPVKYTRKERNPDGTYSEILLGYGQPQPIIKDVVTFEPSGTLYFPTLINDEGVTLGQQTCPDPDSSVHPLCRKRNDESTAASSSKLLKGSYGYLGSGTPAIATGSYNEKASRAIQNGSSWIENPLLIWDYEANTEVDFNAGQINRRQEMTTPYELVRNGVQHSLSKLVKGYTDIYSIDMNNHGVILAHGYNQANSNYECILLTPKQVDVTMITPAGDPVDSPVDQIGFSGNTPDGANEFTYSTGFLGVLTINLKAKVPGISTFGKTIQGMLKFDVDPVGDSVMTWQTGNEGGKVTVEGDYIKATVKFTGLPTKNSSFGKKKARVMYAGRKAAESNYEVFFPKSGINHPGSGYVTAPNWFYYWRQGKVCGIPSDALYDENGDYGYVKPELDNKLRLGPLAADTNTGPETFDSQNSYGSITVTGQGKGIQCVAETAEHELHHLIIFDDKQGKLDTDTDGVADASEQALDEVSTNPNDSDTFRMRDTYEVYETYGDNEIRCRKKELKLTIQYFSKYDWANPGCQNINQFGPKP
jgi:hypothetical protein